MSRPFFIRLIGTCLLVLLSSAGAAFTPDPSDSELESKTHYNDPLPTTVLVRVAAHRCSSSELTMKLEIRLY